MAHAVVRVGNCEQDFFREMEMNILKKFHGAAPTLASQSLAPRVHIPEEGPASVREGRRSSYTQGIDDRCLFSIVQTLEKAAETIANMSSSSPTSSPEKKSLWKRLLCLPRSASRVALIESSDISLSNSARVRRRRSSIAYKQNLVAENEVSFVRRYSTLGNIDRVMMLGGRRHTLVYCIASIIVAHCWLTPKLLPAKEAYVKYENLFRDANCNRRNLSNALDDDTPCINDIIVFLTQIHEKLKMEYDSMLAVIVYIERLNVLTDGEIRVTNDNWKSVCLACCVLANKMWDDFSMWNEDMSRIDPNFPLARINELELGMVQLLDYELCIDRVTFGKYLFAVYSIPRAVLDYTDLSPDTPTGRSPVGSPVPIRKASLVSRSDSRGSGKSTSATFASIPEES